MSRAERLGSYRLGKRLGQGGMGTVYAAEHVESGAQHALKLLPNGAPAELVLRFQREAEAQARVDGHPHVLRVHAAGAEGGQHFIVMDLAPGGDLAQRLVQGPLAEAEAVDLVERLARGLAHVHAQGILHRDIKPQNVLFADDGRPLLVDFGLAHLTGGQSLTEPGEILGTPAYMAPEQVTGAKVDARADVYGLGALLYHALTGRPPFQGKNTMSVLADVVETEPPAPRSLRPELSAAVERVCLRALAKRPARRYPDAEAFGEALRQLREGSPSSRRRPPFWAALVAVALLIGGVAALLLRTTATSRPVAESPSPTASEAPTTTTPTSPTSSPPETTTDAGPTYASDAEVRAELERLVAMRPTNERETALQALAADLLTPHEDAQDAEDDANAYFLTAMCLADFGGHPAPELVRALLRQGARLGSFEAADELGSHLWDEVVFEGRSGCYDQALAYLRQAAEDVPELHRNANEIWIRYADALVQPPDSRQPRHQEARKWLEEAASRNSAQAMRRIARALYLGQGCEVDPDQACLWFTRSFDAGEEEALTVCAELMLEDHPGAPADLARARELFETAADTGKAECELSLARFLVCHGDGERDRERGMSLLLSWHAQQEPLAARFLADISQQEGRPADRLRYLRQAAKWGDRYAARQVRELSRGD